MTDGQPTWEINQTIPEAELASAQGIHVSTERSVITGWFITMPPRVSSGYAPVIRLKMAIPGRHVHIHTDKTDISR